MSKDIGNIMIKEKTTREMYAKNREKIMQKARNSKSGFFGVGFLGSVAKNLAFLQNQ